MLQRAGMIVLLGISLLLGAQFLLPITISHATSASMAPAIDAGDAYIVVETEPAEVGDVITFYSPTHGEYVTHRVVDRTTEGFITRGDANSQTDQATGMPAVPPSTVLGTVFAVNGRPVTLPGAGGVLAAIEGRNLLLAAGLLVVLFLDIISGRSPRRPDREVLQVRDVATVLLVGAFIWCLAVVALSGGEYEITYVVSAEETPAEHTVMRGQPSTQTVSLSHQTTPVTAVFIETSGAKLIDQRTDGAEQTIEIRTPPRSSIGVYTATVRTRSYPATLPTGFIELLHRVHWVLAGFVSLVPVFVPMAVAYLLIFDGKTPLRLNGYYRSDGPGRSLR